tara:strand:- start:2894 stop:3052 length:159 start_codon:yes stop_codon:yes gene_type:complete
MPYQIRKLPNKNLYRVRGEDGTVIAKSTTLIKAKKQIQAISISKRLRAIKKY